MYLENRLMNPNFSCIFLGMSGLFNSQKWLQLLFPQLKLLLNAVILPDISLVR
jgi:hypothetical protein